MKLELKYPCLADENEREEGAKFFTEKYIVNSVKSLKFNVGPLKTPSLFEQIDEYVKFKLPVQSLNIEEKGFIFKKKVMSFVLKPQTINHESMLNVADAMYDLILAFDVAVDIQVAE